MWHTVPRFFCVSWFPWELEGETENDSMGKYVICDTATHNHGKTQTLLKVIDRLKLITDYEGIEETQINEEDKYASFQINNNIIVVETLGDPVPDFNEYLMRAVEIEAKVIVCASRASGYSFMDVYNLRDYEYEVIRFSNFYSQTDNLPCKPFLIDDMAQAVVQLALKLLAL